MNRVNISFQNILKNKKQENNKQSRSLLKIPCCDSFTFAGRLSEEEKQRRAYEFAKKGVSSEMAYKFAQYNDTEYNMAMNLIDLGFIAFQIPEIIEGGEAKYNRAVELVEHGCGFGEVRLIASLDDEKYEKALDLLNKKAESSYVCSFVHFEDEQYRRVQELLPKKLSNYFIDNAAKFDDELYKRVLKLVEDETKSYIMSMIFSRERDSAQQAADYIISGSDPFLAMKASDADEEDSKKLLPFIRTGIKNLDADLLLGLDDDTRAKVLKLVERGCNFYNIGEIIGLQDKAVQNKMLDLCARGVTHLDASRVINDEKYDKYVSILNEGIDTSYARLLLDNDEYYNNVLNNLKSKNAINPMNDFLNSDEYPSLIQKYSTGKYQQELLDMLSLNKMDYTTKKQILECGLNPQDFLDSLSKLSKSSFKFAMNTPNQYLSNIPVKYTAKVNGKYPQLQPYTKKAQQIQVCRFFRTHIGELARALKYIDTDTLNQMMDKRFELFATSLAKMNGLSDENYELLSGLIKCETPENKPLTAKQKIQLVQIMEIYQDAKLDTAPLKEVADSGVVDVSAVKEAIKERIFKNAGLSDEQIKNIPPGCEKFDEEYSYLLLMNLESSAYKETKEMFEKMKLMDKKTLQETADEYDEYITDYENTAAYKSANALKELKNMILHVDNYSIDELLEKYFYCVGIVLGDKTDSNALNDVVKQAALGNFENYIFDETNEYGKCNSITKEMFERYGLSYEKWLNPKLGEDKIKIRDKELTIKMWDRIPQKDLFMGNKTTCCTAIGTGANALATPLYLLSTAFNVVDIYSEDGDLIGMSRVFAADVDNKPSLIMDNIEFNSAYVKDLTRDERARLRDALFDYMEKYAQKITNNKDADVYFYANDVHVPMPDLRVYKINADFIGKIPQESIYINAAGCKWVNTDYMQNEELSLIKINERNM